MRICNWCVLFLALFCGLMLSVDLKYRYAAEAQYTMVEYNRVFDRAAEDALSCGITEECADGSLKIDGEKVRGHFVEQAAFVLDLVSESQRERLSDRLAFTRTVNWPGELSAEDGSRIREELEEKLAAHTPLSEKRYLLLLATVNGQEWAQNLKNHAFYSFLELPDAQSYPWTEILGGEGARYALSGAELVKKK